MNPQNRIQSTDKDASRRRVATGRPIVDKLGRHAAKIRQLRLAAGLSQGELAGRLGVTASAVTNWEHGYTRPDIETIIKMCSLFSVSADELLSVADHGKRPTEKERLFLEDYRGLNAHDRLLVDKLVAAMQEAEYNEFKKTFPISFKRRPLSPLSACAGTGVDLSGGGSPVMVLLRDDVRTRDCDEIVSIVGDSMEPEYHSGDRVMVEYAQKLQEGETGIFVVAGEGMIKVCRRDGLHSLNPAYPTVHPGEDDGFRCVGRVLGVLTAELLPTSREQAMIDELERERRG